MSETEVPEFRNVVDPDIARRFRDEGWWGDTTLADQVRRLAQERPDLPAYITPSHRLSWRAYDEASDRLAAAIIDGGFEPGERVAVLLTDGATIHVALLAGEKAGVVSVGIGARAGDREIEHTLKVSGATGLVTFAEHRGVSATDRLQRLRDAGIAIRRLIVLPVFEADPTAAILIDGEPAPAPAASLAAVIAGRRMGPDDLFLINSTSGTTGLPKCVAHTLNSKMYMANRAVDAARMNRDDVMMGLAPVPFGFGLFSTHFTGTAVGAPVVLMDRYSTELAIELIEREKVTVLVCVSTQFKMMLNSPALELHDMSSMRAMFTGGEAIPYGPAAAFEAKTGAKILNFYGSNESGMATGTTLDDEFEPRLRTGGRPVPGTDVRLFDDDKADVTASGYGQPGSWSPANCIGYYRDPKANEELFAGPYVLHADYCSIDEEGYLHVVGRRSDIIIRGGKNVSAAVVEAEAMEHPAVALAAAIAWPDELFGERVCVYVELSPGASITLTELTAFMKEQGVSNELLPEHLVVLDHIPRSSGSKIAKGELREDAIRRAAESAKTS